MEKTLYLNENRGMTIVRDGPSLWITIDGKAGRRVPARFISQVVVTGNVKLDTGAITLFTGNGIPVIFLNRRGDILATALGVVNPDWRLKERQTILFTNSLYSSRVNNWILGKKRTLQLQFLKTVINKELKPMIAKGFREKDFKRITARYFPEDINPVRVVTGTIKGMAYELITGLLMKSELDPHQGFIHRRYNLGLVRDLSYIIDAEIVKQAIQFFKFKEYGNYFDHVNDEWELNSLGLKNIVMRYESHKEVMKDIINSLIDDIFQLMREVSI